MKKLLLTLTIIVALFGIGAYYAHKNLPSIKETATQIVENTVPADPMSIVFERTKEYPGSEFVIEETLPKGSNYNRYIASYLSDGYKIYGLLAIPTTSMPEGGYPAIMFNHGYIPPTQYKTTERYVAYFDTLARNGYVVFKSDYRGHGSSEGEPSGAYFSNGYTTDVMNALSSVKKMEEINTEKIGMWGHSLGGFLTLRSMVLTKDIKAGVVWGGVVGSYADIYNEWWSKRRPTTTLTPSPSQTSSGRQGFFTRFGMPSDSDPYWKSISATTYIDDISGPVQLHHGTNDETVPYQLSQILYDRLTAANKKVELYTYPGDDHDITQSFNLAMQRTVEFFDTHLK